MSLKGRDVISIADFSKDELLMLLDIALGAGRLSSSLLKGKIMATLFFEPSTRTRLSFESSMIRLGGNVIGFTNTDATSFAKGESLADAAKMVENYCDIMVVRNPVAGSVREIADAASIPVINAGDGSNEHPTQTLVDLYSIRECQGRIDGLKIALVGDLKYGRTVHSLALALSNFDVEVYFVSPPELTMPQEFSAGLKRYSLKKFSEAIKEADIVYMTRIQKERFPDKEEYERLRGSYVITRNLLREAKQGMRLFHPLPRVGEISEDVDGTQHAYYFRQAANAVAVRKALLAHVMGFC